MAPKPSKPVIEGEPETATASSAYPMQPAEESSDGEDVTSSSEGTDNEENSDGSNDEQEKKKPEDKDDDGSGDPSSGTVEAPSSSTSQAVIVQDYFDASFNDKIEKATSIEELSALHDEALSKATYFWKCKVDLKKRLTKSINEKKEEKKKREKEEKEAKKLEPKTVEMLTLNINIAGENYKVFIKATATLRDIRDALRTNYPRFTGKFLKKLDYIYKGQSLNEHSRRTISKGWKMVDGDSIMAKGAVAGGGKRGRSSVVVSKDEKINAKMLQMQMAVSHVVNLGVPSMESNKKFIQDVSNLLLTTNGIDTIINDLSIEQCKKIQSFIFATNNEASRIDFISKVCYADFFQKIDQTVALSDLFIEAARSLTTYALFKGYLTDSSRMSWESFRTTIEKAIERKQLEQTTTKGLLGK